MFIVDKRHYAIYTSRWAQLKKRKQIIPKPSKIIIGILSIIMLIGCAKEPEASNLKMDHVNIWVKNPKEAKEKLEAIGFTAVPDSLSQVHAGQGTTGRYFYFLNGYLELIYKYDDKEFKTNANINNSLDFVERSESPDNGYLPFGVALKMKNYNKEDLPFKTIEYHQEWMGESNRIYAAKNSKTKKEEPSIFVVYPFIEFDVFESMDSLTNIPDAYSIWRTFYKHKNGAEKISLIKIYSNKLDPESETIKTLSKLKNIEIKEGKEYLMEVFFDHQRQNKTYDLRPELPLKIYL